MGRPLKALNYRSSNDKPQQEERHMNHSIEIEEKVEEPRRVVNTIAEGFARGGSTSTARKKHLHNVRFVSLVAMRNRVYMLDITFTGADFKGLDPKQDDPMAITIQVANFLVKKTFIDKGISTKILFWNTFKQLDILESTIQPYDDPLFGFAGE
ncbi:hypothetical protein JHK82_016181 [Glycine max]|nr:hypothetical protein JHK85_016580 [Glycine max]KAG5149300.1 hypothetical protein JHK82_016181 [Glycine max]